MAIAGTQTLNDAVHTGAPGSEDSTNRRIDDLRSLALDCLEDMKAEETIEIDLMGRTSLADTMIITSGRSQRHVGAIADRVLQEMKSKGLGTARVEGLPACDWVLIDANDVIVHVFQPEVRNFYNIEKMWAGTPRS